MPATVNLPAPVGRQRDVLYLPARGHFVVLGTAGSGKTTLAILRSAYLGNSNTSDGGPTLLVTFNRALVTYLKHFRDPNFQNVTVENYHRFARGYLGNRGRMGYNTICRPELRARLIADAVSQAAVSNGHSAHRHVRVGYRDYLVPAAAIAAARTRGQLIADHRRRLQIIEARHIQYFGH
jgi:hypothetical protein